jgi:putative FmdB family regulatory protein
MPLREYQCDACGHRFEVIQKMSDPPLDTCPKCGEVLRKLQAAPAFHLKGTGWYATDYAKKDQSSAKSEDESKGAKSAGAKDKDTGSGDKTETKSDSAKSSAASDTSASTASSTPSPAPAKAPAKEP